MVYRTFFSISVAALLLVGLALLSSCSAPEKKSTGTTISEKDLPPVQHVEGEVHHDYPPGAPQSLQTQENPLEGGGDARDLDIGKELYEKNCLKCHGAKGDGKGPESAGLNPPPAAFNTEHFPEMDERLVFYIITTGIEGSDMPSWGEKIKPLDRWRLIRYLLSLAPPQPEHGDEH